MLLGVIFFVIPTLIGSGIVWWCEGPSIGEWLRGLLPRLIPLGALSLLIALGMSVFTLKHYSELRENGPDAAYMRDMIGGGFGSVAFFLLVNQILYGWPGQLTHAMGILVTISAGMGVCVGVVFLITLCCEVIYRWRNR